MKKLILVILFTTSISAQSIHQIQSEFYSKQKFEIKSFDNSKTVNLFNKTDNKPFKAVFGYLPYWEYYSGTHKNIRYDLLTHLAIFLYEADGSGNLIMPINLPLPWTDVFTSAAANNVKLILTVASFNTEDIHLLLSDNIIRQNLIDNIRKLIEQFNLDGVNIDFENVREGDDRRYRFKDFMGMLKIELSKINPDIEVSAALPSIAFGTWDFKSISDQIDYAFVMCYDYYGQWAATTGPSAPLTGEYISVTKTISQEYQNVPPEKIIMGVPYYGNLWRTNSGDPYSSVAPYDTSIVNNNWQSHVFYRDIFTTFSNYEELWDSYSNTSWMRLNETDTSWFQIWYDDSLSLSLKYDFALTKNLKGVGIWALGYDGNRNELWNLIKEKFVNPVSVYIEQPIADDFIVYQNYPNPFNPSTTISYFLEKPDFVSIKIFDVLGREVETIINKFRNSGFHSVTWNSMDNQCAGGVYFYRFTSGSHSVSKKMILLE